MYLLDIPGINVLVTYSCPPKDSVGVRFIESKRNGPDKSSPYILHI